MRKFLLVVLILLVFLAAGSAWFLVINDPQKADVILVLAGETEHRSARGLELLSQGYGSKLILDVPAAARIYQWSQTELAQKYVDGLPQASLVMICPIAGLSTNDETKDAERCLRTQGGHRVLLVTSDYHTRRALSIFSKRVPGYEFSVAAAYDPREFGALWWTHREWAKVNFDEWVRLLWWELFERWR